MTLNTNKPVLPIVHLNGTSREALIEQRLEVVHKLREVLDAMYEAAPHIRDYYVGEPGLWGKALAQHQHRLALILGLRLELEEEIDVLSDV
jgi:hypothetical protein